MNVWEVTRARLSSKYLFWGLIPLDIDMSSNNEVLIEPPKASPLTQPTTYLSGVSLCYPIAYHEYLGRGCACGARIRR